MLNILHYLYVVYAKFELFLGSLGYYLCYFIFRYNVSFLVIIALVKLLLLKQIYINVLL